MENINLPSASKKNKKVKMIRSKSKGIYTHQRNPKLKI